MPKGYSNKTGLPIFQKGHNFLGGTKGWFKKGQVSPFKGKKRPEFSGEKSPLWGKKFPNRHSDKQFKKGQVPWNKGLKHSDETKKKMKEKRIKYFLNGGVSPNKGKHLPQLAGKNCHFWKGGITPENHKIRTSLEMKLFKKACLERDNFTCQKTGQIGGKLVVHHINNFADFKELRTSIENGITLSEKAHKEFHKIYGKKNNTMEQLLEFLNK